MNEKVSNKEIVLSVSIFAVMIAFLIYGFIGLEVGRTDNCWSKYSTEREAIMHCEGTNE
jgi:hypothetical protein